MEILIKAAQLLLSLSILVVLHEFGHFLPARLFGTRVEKFYLFFDWKFSLLKWKKGDTEYGLGWIPLGGYVKIAGMIDESMDTEQMKKPAESWEFRAKPAWQRLIIMVGGVTVNLLLGFAIYAMILFAWGKEELPLANAKYGVECDSLLLANGFKDGDKILLVGDQIPFDTKEFTKLILFGDHQSVTVDRNGAKMLIELPANFKETLLERNSRAALIYPRIPAVVEGLEKGYPAFSSGLKPGDRIVGINDVQDIYLGNASSAIEKGKGKAVTLTVQGEDKSVRQLDIVPNKDGKLGISWKAPNELLRTVTTQYSFFEAIPAGVDFGLTKLSEYVAGFKLMFSKAGVQQLSGFGGIGSMFAPKWDWETFWQLTAFLSIALAFMNILPIPALDGGHVIFLFWEMIAGKPAPEKVMEYAQYVGMILLLGLMLFANGNDIFKAFFK